MEELKQPLRYIFIQTCLKEGIVRFRAKHVFRWLKLIHPEGKAYYQQVHVYILKPLLQAGLINQDEDKSYVISQDAKDKLSEVAVKKRGKKSIPKNGIEKRLSKTTQSAEEDLGFPTEDKEGEEDEWDKHIREKMRTLKSSM